MRMILIDKRRIVCYYTDVNKIDSQIEPSKKAGAYRRMPADLYQSLRRLHQVNIETSRDEHLLKNTKIKNFKSTHYGGIDYEEVCLQRLWLRSYRRGAGR